MIFQKENLDLLLVPSGLLIMFGYHLFLLYRYLKLPHTTVMGFENNDKKAWVEGIMKLDTQNVGTALTVLSSHTTASNFLSTVSLTLSSIIGIWISNNQNIFGGQLIYGDTRASTISIKYISLLIFFILAFSCFVQSTRCFIHATYLISTPINVDIPVDIVELFVIRGGEFWSLGLRGLYFAINLLLWFFGPIPMFGTSLVMVVLLYHLDTNTTPLHRQHRRPQMKKLPGERAEERPPMLATPMIELS